MPQVYQEASQSEDKSPCAGLRDDLKECLLKSDCVTKLNKSAKECLISKDPSVPDECYRLRVTFFECKRSLLDARQRFRGRKGY